MKLLMRILMGFIARGTCAGRTLMTGCMDSDGPAGTIGGGSV
jgi:hypothetical protein